MNGHIVFEGEVPETKKEGFKKNLLPMRPISTNLVNVYAWLEIIKFKQMKDHPILSNVR